MQPREQCQSEIRGLELARHISETVSPELRLAGLTAHNEGTAAKIEAAYNKLGIASGNEREHELTLNPRYTSLRSVAEWPGHLSDFLTKSAVIGESFEP